ncbi:hypothetical protein IFM89_016461 [Coptis chinensis]|uniref:Amine oxidase domain-containing protein n=1 Tax=Coptis chinensis TaxID=261450 RepID=A0A835I4H7_9MAGN|nr:hypothetical protein IFM89_016461 [Coptis chinensis]
MTSAVSKVAIVGSGISGAVCASTLARNGVSVTIFDSGRGPGGRMSQRREITEDGKELFFDHGAPLFVVTDKDVMALVCEWEARGLVAEWKENIGIFDCGVAKFVGFEKEGSSKKYVGLPGMNAICRAMCHEPGVEAKFGVTVGTLQWLEDKKLWLPIDMNGQPMGHFDAMVAADIYVASPRFTAVTGRPPPLDINLVPQLAVKLQEVPALSCFTLMMAFSEPLSLESSQFLSAYNIEIVLLNILDSSKGLLIQELRRFKLGLSRQQQARAFHHQAQYAKRVINQTGPQMLASSAFSNIAEELLQEFQSKFTIPRPFFMRAHRWDTAFPAIAVARDEKCLYDDSKRFAMCGDFCVSPNVEGAVLSGIGAAAKILDVLCSNRQNGVSVTIFESGRGPGGRMSQRREITEDGKELYFDHGSPLFTVTNNKDVMAFVCDWETRGLVTEWKDNFGIFDSVAAKFIDFEKEGSNKKYVGTPGMNAVCRAMCNEPGVEAKFGITVGTLQWLEEKNSWLPIGLDGQTLGEYDAVVASDKNIVSPRSTAVTGQPPPLDMTLVPDLAPKLQEVPVLSCFSLMLAFSEPLLSIPVRGFSFQNNKILSRAFCDSSKPGRSATSERWVLHSTAEYAKRVISQTGLQKLSNSILSNVAEELFLEFQRNELNIPRPIFMKAHRWGSAFPAVAVAGDEKCLWDSSKRLAICGDFCVSPNVEGAILSGMGAAAKILHIRSSV